MLQHFTGLQKDYEIRSKGDNETLELTDFFFDVRDKDWRVRHLVVSQNGKKLVIPTDGLKAEPDPDKKTLLLDFQKDKVKEFSSEEKAKEAVLQKGDSGLTSAEETMNNHVQAKGGKFKVNDFIFDFDNWNLRYLVIFRKELWFLGTETLMATDWVTEFNAEEKKIKVDFTKERIKNAPDYTPLIFNRNLEDQVLFFYGKKKSVSIS